MLVFLSSRQCTCPKFLKTHLSKFCPSYATVLEPATLLGGDSNAGVFKIFNNSFLKKTSGGCVST